MESDPPPPQNDDPPPVPQQSGQHKAPRLPSGQHTLPRRPTAHYAGPRHSPGGHHHVRPAKKGTDLTLFYILGAVVVICGVVYWTTRDTWEQDNKAFILSLKHDADSLRATQKRAAWEKYETLLKLANGHTLKDPEVKYAYDEAKRQIIAANLEIEKNGGKDPAAKADAVRDAPYAKYVAKSQPLLDALMRVRLDAENAVTQQKYQDDVVEASLQYTKWYEAIDTTENAYASAALFKVAKESYSGAGNWWSIETDRKMPDALFASIKRRNEWSQGAYVLDKIKFCMDSKDILERKRCSPCDGTGKIKCPICRGDGICQFCKGKKTPELNCCENGACFACKGRKESECLICKAGGEFPPK